MRPRNTCESGKMSDLHHADSQDWGLCRLLEVVARANLVVVVLGFPRFSVSSAIAGRRLFARSINNIAASASNPTKLSTSATHSAELSSRFYHFHERA